MATAITSKIAQETAANTRPVESSAPSVSPPCVYTPHGAPKTDLKGCDADDHDGSSACREKREHRYTSL
jgi:hypothetical protein